MSNHFLTFDVNLFFHSLHDQVVSWPEHGVSCDYMGLHTQWFILIIKPCMAVVLFWNRQLTEG